MGRYSRLKIKNHLKSILLLNFFFFFLWDYLNFISIITRYFLFFKLFILQFQIIFLNTLRSPFRHWDLFLYSNWIWRGRGMQFTPTHYSVIQVINHTSSLFKNVEWSLIRSTQLYLFFKIFFTWKYIKIIFFYF